MLGTKLLALGAGVIVIGCGAGAATPNESARPRVTQGLSSLPPAERLAVIQATNDATVARTRTLDAEDAYEQYTARLAQARRKGEPAKRLQPMEEHVEYLRKEWTHARAAEQLSQTRLALARAQLAQKKRLTGYGSVKQLERRLKLDEANEKAAQARVDRSLAMARMPDLWELSRSTSHNRASRLEQAIEFFEAMSQVVVNAKADCKLMTTRLRSLFTRRSDMIMRLRDGGDVPLQKIHESARYQRRARAAADKMMSGIAACIRDPDIQYLLGRLQPPRPSP